MQIELNSRGILSAVFRQRVKTLIVSALILAAGGTYLATTKPTYESVGSVLLKFGRDAMPELAKTDSSSTIISQNDRREMMQSSMDILRSRDLIAIIVHEAGPDRIYPGISEKVAGKDSPLEAAVRKLRNSDISLKAGQQSNLIELRVTDEDPALAAWFAKALLNLFIAKQSEVYNPPQTEFLDEQVKLAAKKLAASQKKLQDYKAASGISSIEAELEQLLKEKSETTTITFESADNAEARLAGLKVQEAELLATYQPDSPQVKKIRQSIALVRGQLGAKQADLKSRSKGMLGAQRTKIDKRIAELEAKRSEYNDLARAVTIDEENYKNYQAKREEAEINTMLAARKVSRVSIVDEPTIPVKPVHPRKLMVLAICLLASAVFGLGFAFMCEAADIRFTSPSQITHLLSIPVLATFSAEEDRGPS